MIIIIKKSKETLFTAVSNNNDNIRTNWITKTRKQKWEEKQLYILSDKLAKSPIRRPGHGYQKETLREKRNLI